MTEPSPRLLTADVPPRLADGGTEARRHPTPSALARGVVQSSLDGIMVFASVRDRDGIIRDFRWMQVNQVAGDIVGRAPAELIGECLLEQMPGNLDSGLFDRYVAVVESGRTYRTEAQYHHETVEGTFRITAARVDDGFAVTFRDITAERTQERSRAALHDSLTDLPNRMLLNDRLERLSRLSAIREVNVAIMVIDLDRFALVNQTFGPERADELLTRTARRLEAVVDHGDTVARTGGDEFTLICHDLRDDYTIGELCDAVTHACIDDVGDDDATIRVTASVGVAMALGQHVTGDMVRDAHAAMHRAKANGRGRVEFADDSLRQEIANGAEIVRGLSRALENDEFEVHFQPIFTPQRELRSAEALVRWRRNGDLIPPGVFLPVAEEHGLIGALGRHVLRVALHHLADWDRTIGVGCVPSISVNLAADQLDDSLPTIVAELLDAAGLEPHRLCLEVTESSLIRQPDRAGRALAELADSGVRIALDDFGTGYSPLTYLKQLPVQIIKIDRSFVATITDDPTDAAVVEAVVGLSHRLGKRVVAEGVETLEQLQLVEQLGIDAVQGFLLGRPSVADDIAAAARTSMCRVPDDS